MGIPHLLQVFAALALLAAHTPAAASDAQAQPPTAPLLLPDRSWFSQVARVRQRPPEHPPPPSVDACASVGSALLPGDSVRGYELAERSALLGVCSLPRLPRPVLQVDVAAAVTPWNPTPSAVVPIDRFNDGLDAGEDAKAAVCPLIQPPPRSVASLASLAPPATTADASIADGPVLEYQYVPADRERLYVDAHYRLRDRFDAGSHGEVWKASRADSSDRFVLKRLLLPLQADMVQMGLREAHFGSLLAGQPHVTRFVEYFFRPPLDSHEENHLHKESGHQEADEEAQEPELWLVFHDEGMSLRHYLYEKQETFTTSTASDTDASTSGVFLQRSRFWHKMRADVKGELVLREIVRQLLEGVAALHARGITHRDIKPSNILLALPTANSSAPVVKLADFGSAVDEYTARQLYPPGIGPTQAEETREYQPPEVLFSRDGRPFDAEHPLAYDLWSVGVVFLEMLLGSPHVFLISSRAQAKLDAELQRLDRRSSRSKTQEKTSTSRDEDKDARRAKAYLLHVLTREFCLFQPAPQQLRSLWDKYAVTSESCHLGRFNETVVARDPLHKGLELPFALDLLWRLLQWAPSDRISAKDALQHAFFRGAYVCHRSGRQFATERELRLHEQYLRAQLARDHALASVVRERVPLPGDGEEDGHGFKCPQCSRTFATVASCEQHVLARRHFGANDSRFCSFDARHVLDAVHRETMTSEAQKFVDAAVVDEMEAGVALFQGRKKYMEDFVLVQRAPDLQEQADAVVFAVSDGHLGEGAATFVLEHLVDALTRHLNAVPTTPTSSNNSDVGSYHEAAEKMAMRQTFLELHERFLAHSAAEDRQGDDADDDALFSGCTLTVAVLFPSARRLVAANVGDSRALAWSPAPSSGGEARQSKVTPLSMDHWPNEPSERARIESSGGFVRFQGLWRVVGQLAVSRSLGDRHLRRFVTAEPSVFHLSLPRTSHESLLVLASDGLWESMDLDQVARFLAEAEGHKPLDALAADLAAQSYVRGGLDNVAVLLVRLP